MKEGILTGHHIVVHVERRLGDLCTTYFGCEHCDLCGHFSGPPELVDATVADLMATHWAATGGDQ